MNELHTPTDVPPEVMRCWLSWVNYPDWQRTVALGLRAQWNRTIPDVSAVLCWEAAGGRHEHPDAFEWMEDCGPNLLPNCPHALALDPDLVDDVKSRALVLSPAQHWIELRSRGREFYRIPGAIVAEFFDKTDEQEES